MNLKALEIRDEGTFIPAIAIQMNQSNNEGQRYLLRRCGYEQSDRDKPTVLLLRMDGSRSGRALSDPYDWGDRTWHIAHLWIIDHWWELNDGSVVDVEFALGETTQPKVSECVK